MTANKATKNSSTTNSLKARSFDSKRRRKSSPKPPKTLTPSTHEAPWLMFPPQEESKVKTTCHFLNLEEERIIELTDMPKVYSESCCIGSSHGWLVCMDESATPFLINPFTSERLKLPSITTLLSILNIDKNCEGEFEVKYTYTDYSGSFHSTLVVTKQLRETFIQKAVLSSAPSIRCDNYEVVLIYGLNSKLAFHKSGDSSWSDLDGKHSPYIDIIFHENKLYALGNGYSLEVWDFNDGGAPMKRMDIETSFEGKIKKPENFSSKLYASKIYLVQSCGDILLVVRYIGEFVNGAGEPVYESDLLTDNDTHPLVFPYRTLHFYVYKLDLDQKKLVEVDTLGHCSLFLGGNHSLSISEGRDLGIKENSIYFTDDYWERMNEDYLYGGHDMGVFSLQDQSIKPICECTSEKIQPPPSWIVPPNPLSAAKQFL